jgi:HSP20 family protein
MEATTPSDRAMRCEQYDQDGCVVVRAELPGVDPDRDVEVTVVDGVLRIDARRHEEPREWRHRSEFFYGEMIRTLVLPPDADGSAVTATYQDGILEVVVPLTSGSRPRI